MSIIDDGPSSTLHNSYSHLSTQEKCARLIDESDGGKIYPLTFPKPQASPEVISNLAAQLRTSGEGISDTGNDITTTWGGLTSCYESPGHDHELYAVLNPVARDGDKVQSGLNRVAGALEDFAETLEGIQGRWDTLSSEAYEFRGRIADKGDDWDDGVGFLWLQDNDDVVENQRLYDLGVALIDEYEEAERDCANRINAGLVDRTRFEATPSDTENLDDDVFYHGHEGDLSDLVTEWDIGPSGTDLPWWGDAGSAVWDFGVGAVEGTGAMLGMHSSEGWFNMSWGDALFEYHEDNIQSSLGLVGLYDAESDSYGLAGLDSVGSAWKDLAHSVVPWEEWDERPGYVIGTALLNIGATVGGAVLTATGVGAPVGVALMAWRGMAILDGMGGSGRGGSGGADLDLDMPDMPRFGGPDSPVVRVNSDTFNTDNFTPDQLADMQRSLNQVRDLQSGGGGGGSGSRPTQPSEGTEDSRPTRPTTRPAADDNTPATNTSRTDSGDEAGSESVQTSDRWGTDVEENTPTNTRETSSTPEGRAPSARPATEDRGSTAEHDRASGTDRSGRTQPGAGEHSTNRTDREHDPSGDRDSQGTSNDRDREGEQETVQARTDRDGQDSTPGERQDSGSSTRSRQDPTAEQLSRGDRLLNQLNAMFSTKEHAQFQANTNAEMALRSGDRALDDPSSSPLLKTQMAEKFGLEPQMNSDFANMRAAASDYPHVWEADPGNGRPNSGPESDKVPAEVGASPKEGTAGAQRTPDSGGGRPVKLDDVGGSKSNGDRVGERAKLDEGESAQVGAKGILAAGMARAGMGGGGKGPTARGNASPTNSSHSGGGDKKTPSTPTKSSSSTEPSGSGRKSGTGSTRGGGPEPGTGSRKGGEGGSSPRSGSHGDTPAGRRDSANQPGTGPRRDSEDPKDGTTRREDTDQKDGGTREDGGDSRDDTSTSRRDDHQNDRDGSGKQDGRSDSKSDKESSDPGTDTSKIRFSDRSLDPADRYRAARKFLGKEDWKNPAEFVKKFTSLLNDHPELREVYYRKDGQRWDADAEVGKYVIPEIEWLPDKKKWSPKSELPPPAKPRYQFPENRIFPRVDGDGKNYKLLDEKALDRRQKIDRSQQLNKKFEKAEANRKPGDEAEFKKLGEDKSKAHGEMNRASEAHGEATAAEYHKTFFNKDEVYEFVKTDENGNKSIVKGTLPETEGGNLLDRVDTAPGSGALQFDGVRRIKFDDGVDGFVIDEAKGDIKTELGERKVGTGSERRRISQGVNDYVTATAEEMLDRGRKDKRTFAELQEKNVINEGKLAKEILRARKAGRLFYALVKGMSDDSGNHTGAAFNLFDISEKP